jgi:dTDP-4-dehydrorhamnose reductase
MVKTLLRLAEERDTLSFVDDQVGHPTFAADLAGMVAKLAIERVPGVFHTTNQGAVSWFGFAQSVFAAAGHDPGRISAISTAELQPPRPAPRPANSVLDNLAWRLHGFRPSRDYREPLAELVERLLGE